MTSTKANPGIAAGALKNTVLGRTPSASIPAKKHFQARVSEQGLQRTLADHLRARAVPGIYWFHPANGGGRSAIEGAILKACGVRAGTPDLILIKDGRTYGLELKADKGRVSPAQAQAHEEMRKAGAEVAVATGIDEAIKQLEAWQLLRGAAQ